MRIYWRDFVGLKIFKVVEAILLINGYRLHLEFNAQKVCTDAYIVKLY